MNKLVFYITWNLEKSQLKILMKRKKITINLLAEAVFPIFNLTGRNYFYVSVIFAITIVICLVKNVQFRNLYFLT